MKKIRQIFSENPYQKMWDTFMYFESEPTTKQFLLDIYNKKFDKDSYKYAFQNTSKFIYFIKQAKEYFFSAEKSHILVKPLLIYYGMMSLMKAYILTRDPNYPSRTSVLRHGITTRKLKKNNYQFHDDEIKIQKDGLFPWFYTLFTDYSIEKIEGNKYKIKELLSLIPELHDSYHRLFNERSIFPLGKNMKDSPEIQFSITDEILNVYKENPKQILYDLNHSLNVTENDLFSLINKKEFLFHSKNNRSFIEILLHHPMFTIDYKGKIYFRLLRDHRFLLPSTMIDYMIMYNLGMLCRYDTDLWGEIIFLFSSEDMYLINEFLNTTLRKFPNQILNALFDEFILFENN